MAFPRSFLCLDNFRLAFWRLVTSEKLDYKYFYKNIHDSYSMSLDENLSFLMGSIKRGSYEPGPPTIVFHPKKSGVLRPLTILPFRDLIVYQAIVNYVASKMKPEQDRHAFTRCFGAILTNSTSQFFFRSWRRSYAKFNEHVADSFKAGNDYVAEFDIVSCYELIDHGVLKSRLTTRIVNEDLLHLLFETCLKHWTTNPVGRHLRHGIPQGPDASAFLAECVLFRFDELRFKDAKYYRYIDDIRLMAKEEVPLRRALLKLDLRCKELGLVPQAQKINLGKVEDVREITKSIPSMILESVENDRPGCQKGLIKLFRESMVKEKGQWTISNETGFKYALGRLNPRRDVLKRISPLLVHRPDLSGTYARYLKKFRASREVAELLLATLRRDPTYDAAAANYIDAMDCCEPLTDRTRYRQVVNTAKKRSEEDSILIRIAVNKFRGRRIGPKDAIAMIDEELEPLVRNIVIHALFGPEDGSPYKVADCRELLEREVQGSDEDLSRYCGLLLIYDAIDRNEIWIPNRGSNDSVKLLVKGLGIRTRMPKRQGILDGFFDKVGIGPPFPWKRALGKDFRNAENRALRLTQLEIGDPTARILMLDTFNELLVQSFSEAHPSLQAAYWLAAGKNAQPNYGNWIKNGTFTTVLPVLAPRLQQIHEARLKGDLAHAKSRKGKATKPIAFPEAKRLMVVGRAAWTDLIREWRKIL